MLDDSQGVAFDQYNLGLLPIEDLPSTADHIDTHLMVFLSTELITIATHFILDPSNLNILLWY